MYQNRIGAHVNRSIEQGLAGGDSGNQQRNLRPALYLQAIWTVVTKPVRLKNFVQCSLEFLQ